MMTRVGSSWAVARAARWSWSERTRSRKSVVMDSPALAVAFGSFGSNHVRPKRARASRENSPAMMRPACGALA